MDTQKAKELYHHPDAEAIIGAILKHAKKTDPEQLRRVIDELDQSHLPPECRVTFEQI